nr:MAG TPA: hypothetical protein [Caudoviricetes sp.]
MDSRYTFSLIRAWHGIIICPSQRTKPSPVFKNNALNSKNAIFFFLTLKIYLYVFACLLVLD